MQAPVKGFETEKSMLTGHDEKGSTVMKDAIWAAVFGESTEEETP